MKKILLLLALAISSANVALADVPRCWTRDNPKVEDGLYVVKMKTAGNSAQDVAAVLFSLQGGVLTQQDVGTMSDLGQIEIDLKAMTSDELAHAAPGFDWKQETLDELTRLSRMKGIESIQCQPVGTFHAGPHTGGVSLSN